MNKERIQNIINKIKADPSCWNQKEWHCGTVHCIGGHAQIDSGKGSTPYVVRDAREWLDLSKIESDYLFDGTRTIQDFDDFVAGKPMYWPENYDKDGYDDDGLDRFNKPRTV